jgi:hypothetical protein
MRQLKELRAEMSINVLTSNYVEKFFPDNHVRYVSILDGIDTGIDCTANDMIPFKAIMNDMYAKDISKKIKSVLRQKKISGLFMGSKAPYGYKKFEKYKFLVDEPAAEIVRRIFDMTIKGMSCRKIAHTLTLEGVQNPSNYANFNKGKGIYKDCWNQNKISEILKNMAYAGHMVQGRLKKINYKSEKRIRVPKDNWIVVKNTHEPIVSEDDFEKAQLVLKSRDCTRQVKHDYLLKGLVFCSDCKSLMHFFIKSRKSVKKHSYLSCGNYRRFPKLKKCTSHLIRLDFVTDFTVREIENFCKNFNSVKYESKDTEKINKEISSLKLQIESLNSKIDKIYEDKLSGLISNDIFSRICLKTEKSKEILEEKLKTLENSSASSLKNYLRTKEAVQNFLNSSEYNKETIISLVEKIEVGENKEITVVFRYM